jgi:hypothetical protein
MARLGKGIIEQNADPFLLLLDAWLKEPDMWVYRCYWRRQKGTRANIARIFSIKQVYLCHPNGLLLATTTRV